MPTRPIDPARLEGEELRRWYLRTPDRIEAERQNSAAQRYREYFGIGSENDQDVGLTNASGSGSPVSDEGALWIANGRGGWRPINGNSANSDWFERQEPDGDEPAGLPTSPAMSESGELLNVGNPHNPRLKREYIAKYGSWPKTEHGRDYDVSHKRAIADGGTNTLDNIEPMHPVEHRAKHMRDRDAERFGRRPGIARAFGGRVEPPLHGPKVRGIGPSGWGLNVLNLLTGNIRTDSFEDFTTDMLGLPSMDEYRRASNLRGPLAARPIRMPNCPPGWQCA